ncbi:MAG: GNAT family N-acetyltransferase [Lachnospiraceae bacterium]|nr:GNAT family N-acetyltransferase [Lachnospiraceae bacterium]
MNIQFVEFDERFFLLSQKWLNNSEIKKLTMTPDTDENDRIAWYESLKHREDYYIKGILADDVPIGAVGIKHINRVSGTGEYWGYIGEKSYIGKGIGKEMMAAMYATAYALGLNRLTLKVADFNIRACRLYEKQGFVETAREDHVIVMEKILNV